MQPLHELALPLDGQAVGDFTEPGKQGNKEKNLLDPYFLKQKRNELLNGTKQGVSLLSKRPVAMGLRQRRANGAISGTSEDRKSSSQHEVRSLSLFTRGSGSMVPRTVLVTEAQGTI